MIAIVFTLFIGLRHEVGGDWFTYYSYLTRAEGLSLREVSTWGDPGYNALNWLFASHPLGIYGVNLVCAALFSSGLVFFCRVQPRPWLALCLAIPYLVIVVAMGYTRQAVAIAFVMAGLLALERGRWRLFLISIAAAVTFHFTALVMAAFVLPALPGRSLAMRAIRILLVLIVVAALAQTFLVSRLQALSGGYLNAAYQSDGAVIRVAMNVIPAVFLLLWPKRFAFTPQQILIWRPMAFAALVCAALVLLFPSNNVAVDRIALYVIPLQLVVGSRLPSTKFLDLTPAQLVRSVLVYCFATQFIWLNFATNSASWLPYQNKLFL